MIDPAPRFDPIQDEVQAALLQVQQILDYVNENPPTALLRVAILNSLIVSLVSRVEEGFRLLLTTYIAVIEEHIGNYELLNKALTETNVKSAADLLLKSCKPDEKINALDVAHRLVRCLTNEAGFQLFKEQMTENRANLRTKEVTDLAKRIGINNLWKHVSACERMHDRYPDYTDQQIQQKVCDEWNLLFDERDVVVHRISQASGWGETRISPYVVFIRTAIACISDVLVDHLREELRIGDARSGGVSEA